ncbi:MAG: MBL fold metallo-hydrolase [Azoarcus sp.]|jgi:hydroxyacylglutathione hydrolase|nr:MBL fold metallo-hydrolase [Azoarcus sp.]
MQKDLIAWPDSIYAVDSGYARPGLAAVHLIVEDGRVAVVDTAHNRSMPRFLAALAELGLGPEAVDYVFLTHVHLDHAGGTGAYMARLPNAKLVVHPDGARHMIDPGRLYASTLAVYGWIKTFYLYGKLVPVPANRVIEAGDGQVFSLAGRPLQCLYTPGHAKHHLCLWDERARACFTGDTFGIAYRELNIGGEPFLIPATTPTHFDPEVLKNSIRRLLALRPEAMYLTHFSRVDGVERLGEQLLRRIDDFAALAEAAPGTGKARKQAIHEALNRYLLTEAPAVNRERLKPILKMDMELNAQGLAMWIERRSSARVGA